jgi:YggT family protein
VAGAFLLNFIRFVLLGLELVVLARVLLSWVDPQGRSPVAAFIIQTTEPILAPVRRLLPKTGMFDLSPLIVILVIGAILQAIG